MPSERPIVERLESRLLVDRARSELLQAILDYRFQDKLPAETTLATMLNVSRTTVRAALQGLEQDGLITRRRSIGTTINRNVDVASMALHRMVGFDWLLKEQGYAVEPTTSWALGHPDPKLATTFELDPELEYLTSDKSYTADGQLAIHIRDIVPVSQVRSSVLGDPDQLETAGPSLFDISVRWFHKPIHSALAQIVPMVKRKESDTRLNVPRNHAFVRLHEKHMSSHGDVLAHSMVDVDDRYVRFEVYRRR